MSGYLRAPLSPGLVEIAGGGKIKINSRPGHRPLSVGIVGASILQTTASIVLDVKIAGTGTRKCSVHQAIYALLTSDRNSLLL